MLDWMTRVLAFYLPNKDLQLYKQKIFCRVMDLGNFDRSSLCWTIGTKSTLAVQARGCLREQSAIDGEYKSISTVALAVGPSEMISNSTLPLIRGRSKKEDDRRFLTSLHRPDPIICLMLYISRIFVLRLHDEPLENHPDRNYKLPVSLDPDKFRRTSDGLTSGATLERPMEAGAGEDKGRRRMGACKI